MYAGGGAGGRYLYIWHRWCATAQFSSPLDVHSCSFRRLFIIINPVSRGAGNSMSSEADTCQSKSMFR